MAEETSRVCRTCEQRLPIEGFRKNNKALRGFTPHCKDCLLAKDKARWAAMDPETLSSTLARYRGQQREYRIANAEAVREGKADHYRRTKDRHMVLGYAWRRRNPERLRELARGWDARRRAFTKDGISATETAKWARSQKKVCHWCGIKCADRYDIDHIMPLSKGGPHETRNLCIACVHCNRRKNARDPIDFAQSIGKLL